MRGRGRDQNMEVEEKNWVADEEDAEEEERRVRKGRRRRM